MRTEKYKEQKERLPKTGKQVIGQKIDENIVVYQAFNPHIATYAVANQKFGGSHYSFTRMSWIKPGFLWMMYRAGWASKDQQERILAITLPMNHFKAILQQATITSYDNTLFTSQEEWKNELGRTDVRLQWDPDHDPLGAKQERKAIQIGMRGEILKKFCTEWIVSIDDITEFVKNEYQKLGKNNFDGLDVPFEQVIELQDDEIETRIGITKNV